MANHANEQLIKRVQRTRTANAVPSGQALQSKQMSIEFHFLL